MMLSSKILSELCALLVGRFLYDNKMHFFICTSLYSCTTFMWGTE